MLINDAQITGSLTVNASSSFQNIIVSGNILPDTTNIRNLGSVDKYFKEIYVSTGSINFVDSGSVKSTISSAPGGGIQIGSVVITTSSIAFVDSTGSVTQNIAQSSSVGPISDYATSASFNAYTSSTDSVLSSLQTTSASVNVSVSAINTFTSSTSARLNSIETVSSSNLSRLSSLENKTGSLATTGSNTFVGTQVITGSLYITTDLIVQGSSSIQNITGSAVNIGTNTIILNTANPSVRYGGISIIDSGSTGLTGSILWDSTNNNWLYQNPSGSSYVSAKFISGPQSQTLGSESGLVTNFLVKAVGDDHISSSAIFDNGSTVSIKSNAEVTGSLKITSTVNATNLVGIWSGSAQLPAGVVSGSSQITAGSTTNFSTDVKSQLNTNTVISGSGQVSISSTSGFGTYLNQAVLTTSSPTFSAITIGKNGTDSLITFPAQTNDPGYIKHYESNNTAIMYFNVSDDSNDEFRFGYTGDASTFRLRSDGVILAGTWQGSAIANAYLANSSFHVGTTSISLGRASSSQTLTGVSIDGNAATATSATSATTAGSVTGTSTISGKLTISNGTSNALQINTTVADNNTRDGIYLYEADGQASGRQAISWYNGNQSYYKARIWTEVGSGYNATQFGIDVADDARNLGTRMYIRNGSANFSGDVTAYASDIRLKENIKPITNAIDKIKKINGVFYDWKENVSELGFTPISKNDVGVIAQEVQSVFPEIVKPAPFDQENGISKSGNNYLTVKYEKLTPLLLEAIKEQQIKIDNLTVEVENLKKQRGL